MVCGGWICGDDAEGVVEGVADNVVDAVVNGVVNGDVDDWVLFVVEKAVNGEIGIVCIGCDVWTEGRLFSVREWCCEEVGAFDRMLLSEIAGEKGEGCEGTCGVVEVSVGLEENGECS